MKTGVMSGLHPTLKFFMVLIFVLTSALFLTVLGFLVAVPFFGVDDLMAMSKGQASLSLLKYLQMTQSLTVFILPSLLAAFMLSRKPLLWLKFRTPKPLFLLVVVLIFVSVQPLTGWLGYVNTKMDLPDFLRGVELWMSNAEASANSLIFQFLDTSSIGPVVVNFFMMVLLPAFGEELLFRGAIQTSLKKAVVNHHVAVWVTAILFSALHMQFFTFAPRLLLGALLGYLLVYGKSIWYPILGHFTNNLLSFIMFYYYRAHMPGVNPLDSSAERPDWWLILAGTVFMTGLFGWFRSRSKLVLPVVISNHN
ncbi:lysostaphin resistance A-like protein [Geofilum sp. OHC36d9]|uniref:lysostaphin resistance A-like protein n=1 Tax=Geofilum sp. OHC36d9 TaxID=3458413 RepID=UPI0040349122